MYKQITLALILGSIYPASVLACARNHTLLTRQFIHGIAVPNVTANAPAELPSMCMISCTPMLRDFGKCDGIDGGTVNNFVQDEKCLCTDEMYAKLQACTNCLINQPELRDYVSQIMDVVQEFVTNCKNSGNPVSNVTSISRGSISTTRQANMTTTTSTITPKSTSGTETATSILSTADVSNTQAAQSGATHVDPGNLMLMFVILVAMAL